MRSSLQASRAKLSASDARYDYGHLRRDDHDHARRRGDYYGNYYNYDDYHGRGVDRSGAHSGYGHHDHYHKKCCPLVVKPLVFLSLLAGIAVGSAFLNNLIDMNIGRRKRKRRGAISDDQISANERIADLWREGKKERETEAKKGVINILHTL